jgi:signal transduction histidine kinase
MISGKYFQKYFLMMLAILIVFVVFGFFFNAYVSRAIMSGREMYPPEFIAKLVDKLDPDKVVAIKVFEESHEQSGHSQIVLISSQGKVLYPADYQMEFKWKNVPKPTMPYQFVKISIEPEGEPPASPPVHLFGFLSLQSGPPKGPELILTRLSGDPATYLLMVPYGPGGPHEGPHGILPFVGIFSLLISLLLGVGTAVAIIYYMVNKKVRLADEVISELQRGNLKARFPVNRKDEFGQAMIRFNKMADEIEKLVEHLKFVEKARTKLLQELAHDLRTPIASLKSLLETLGYKRQKLDPKVQQEFMDLSLREVEYFERLVEDLLFLAQVSEPKYSSQKEPLNFAEIVDLEAEDCVFRHKHNSKAVKLSKRGDFEKLILSGNAHLLQRLFRNAFENAFSFAQSTVKVSISKNEQQVQILIEDDGPGFSEEALAAFGQRKLSRRLDYNDNDGGRVSVGLGSVVMKTICSLHRGSINASNILDRAGKNFGARVEISLPLQNT